MCLLGQAGRSPKPRSRAIFRTVGRQGPAYRLLTSYSFRAERYALDPSRSEAFNQQNFAFDAFCSVSPTVTVTLADVFVRGTDTNLIASEGVSAGRSRVYSNAVRPGATYQLDPITRLRLVTSYTILRFNSDAAFDSDTLRVEPSLDRVLSERLTGTLGYRFAYVDVQRQDSFAVPRRA